MPETHFWTFLLLRYFCSGKFFFIVEKMKFCPSILSGLLCIDFLFQLANVHHHWLDHLLEFLHLVWWFGPSWSLPKILRAWGFGIGRFLGLMDTEYMIIYGIMSKATFFTILTFFLFFYRVAHWNCFWMLIFPVAQNLSF